MAPKTAKAKKTAEGNEGPKKGRGKAKNVEEVEPEAPELSEVMEVPATEIKNKRGKRGANGVEQNGKTEDKPPQAKRGRKKNEPIPEDKSDNNSEQSVEEEAANVDPLVETTENSDNIDSENMSAGKGRKKLTKKETVNKAGKGKKNTKPENNDNEDLAKDDVKEEIPEAEEATIEKESKSENTKSGKGKKKTKTAVNDDTPKEQVQNEPKPAVKGRGRKAQPKADKETESEEKVEDEGKVEAPAAKGRKKAVAKPTKEKTPESDIDPLEEENEDEAEIKPKVELKKKVPKGRKTQAKKTQAKEVVEDKEEEIEEAPAKKRKVTKKEEKGKGDSKDEEMIEDIVTEAKTEVKAKGKRGQKKAVETEDEEPGDTGEATTKRRRKVGEEKAPAKEDSKKKVPLKNKAVTNYEDIDFSNASKDDQGKDWNFKIASWNVDGIRAWMSKGGLDYIKYEKPDILCLQEVKCSKDKLPEEAANLPGYHAYWLCSEKDGYAGVGIYTTQLAMNVQYGLNNEELDSDGRIITAEYEQFYLICTYVPNAGRKLVTLPKRLQWNEEFRKYVKELDKKKPVIICGDMNVSHNEIDLANPKTNKKNAGFTEEERSGMSDLLGDGYIDTFRQLNPDKTGAYTFWTYMLNSRSKNVGWRLDYFIISERLQPSLCDSVIRDQVYGSDHCPISLFLHLSSAAKPKE